MKAGNEFTGSAKAHIRRNVLLISVADEGVRAPMESQRSQPFDAAGNGEPRTLIHFKRHSISAQNRAAVKSWFCPVTI